MINHFRFCTLGTGSGYFYRRFVSDGSVEDQGYELNYTAIECGSDEFMCLNNGHCMSGNVQCNGEQDCDDWSDEDIDLCGEPEDT